MNIDKEKYELLSKTVAMLSADAVQKANSGHPGLPMGAAGYASVLWSEFLRFNPTDPSWIGRDRFILSAGHGSMLLYSLLHLFGYELSLEDIKSFRQWESKTPGHPEFGFTPGVECTTGPLGQGAANAVGIALSNKLLAAEYSAKLFDNKVYALVSDGDLMEGIASEAASLAGHLGLNNLIYLYDDNKISLAGGTDVCFTESVPDRFRSYGWFVQTVDAADLQAFAQCVEQARSESKRPSIICVRSIIGLGSPAKANSFEAHGSPLGEAELKATKENIGWPVEPKFIIPEEVRAICANRVEEKRKDYDQWNKEFDSWRKSFPEKAKDLDNQIRRVLPEALKAELSAGLGHEKKEATRSLSGKAIQVIAKHLKGFVGGSADLEPSTKTLIKDSGEIQANAFQGRNIRYGVREHAMGAIANGLAYSGCWFPYTATFLVFSDYMRPTVRLAALSHIPTIFIFTHDSFWVGEDGPTHEPIEHVQALRLIPEVRVYRPADGVEVGMSYYAALADKNHPSVLVFTRQDLPPIKRRLNFSPDEILLGGYIVSQEPEEQLVLIATGSEVHIAVEASTKLREQGIGARVVSLPCLETFLGQSDEYRETVIPSKLKKISIEAGVTLGWERIVGSEGLTIGVNRYGASAPGEIIAEKFGLTSDLVAQKIKSWIS